MALSRGRGCWPSTSQTSLSQSVRRHARGIGGNEQANPELEPGTYLTASTRTFNGQIHIHLSANHKALELCHSHKVVVVLLAPKGRHNDTEFEGIDRADKEASSSLNSLHGLPFQYSVTQTCHWVVHPLLPP